MWWFEASPRRAAPKGQPSSSAQHRFQELCLHKAPFRVRGAPCDLTPRARRVAADLTGGRAVLITSSQAALVAVVAFLLALLAGFLMAGYRMAGPEQRPLGGPGERRRVSAQPPGPSDRRRGLCKPRQPGGVACSPHPAHHPRARRPQGQPCPQGCSWWAATEVRSGPLRAASPGCAADEPA
jgi:hypothetical protein